MGDTLVGGKNTRLEKFGTKDERNLRKRDVSPSNHAKRFALGALSHSSLLGNKTVRPFSRFLAKGQYFNTRDVEKFFRDLNVINRRTVDGNPLHQNVGWYLLKLSRNFGDLDLRLELYGINNIDDNLKRRILKNMKNISEEHVIAKEGIKDIDAIGSIVHRGVTDLLANISINHKPTTGKMRMIFAVDAIHSAAGTKSDMEDRRIRNIRRLLSHLDSSNANAILVNNKYKSKHDLFFDMDPVMFYKRSPLLSNFLMIYKDLLSYKLDEDMKNDMNTLRPYLSFFMYVRGLMFIRYGLGMLEGNLSAKRILSSSIVSAPIVVTPDYGLVNDGLDLVHYSVHYLYNAEEVLDYQLVKMVLLEELGDAKASSKLFLHIGERQKADIILQKVLDIDNPERQRVILEALKMQQEEEDIITERESKNGFADRPSEMPSANEAERWDINANASASYAEELSILPGAIEAVMEEEIEDRKKLEEKEEVTDRRPKRNSDKNTKGVPTETILSIKMHEKITSDTRIPTALESKQMILDRHDDRTRAAMTARRATYKI
jgi:hypothetical protein